MLPQFHTATVDVRIYYANRTTAVSSFFKLDIILVGRVFYNLATKSQGIRSYQSKNSLEFVFPLLLSQSEYLRGCLHSGTIAWVSTQYGFVFTP